MCGGGWAALWEVVSGEAATQPRTHQAWALGALGRRGAGGAGGAGGSGLRPALPPFPSVKWAGRGRHRGDPGVGRPRGGKGSGSRPGSRGSAMPRAPGPDPAAPHVAARLPLRYGRRAPTPGNTAAPPGARSRPPRPGGGASCPPAPASPPGADPRVPSGSWGRVQLGSLAPSPLGQCLPPQPCKMGAHRRAGRAPGRQGTAAAQGKEGGAP